MKPQDTLFWIVLMLLFIFFRKPKIFTAAGVFCLVIALPLFVNWIFFTAERLTMYAATFFLFAFLISIRAKSAIQ